MKTITLVIFFMISFKTFASEAFDARVNRLESRLNEVVKSFDERANVVVYAKERKQSKNLNLPSVPFVFKESKSVEEEPRFTSLEISVFSRIETLPPTIRDSLVRLAKEYYSKPQIKLNKVVVYTEEKEDQFQFIKELLPYVAYFAGGIGFLALMFIFLYVRGGSKLTNVLEAQFAILGKTFSEGAGGKNMQASAVSNKEKSEQKPSIEINTSSSSKWEEYSAQTLTAILSDCYWCHEDEYASFIWKKLSISRRNEVLETGLVLKDYVGFISNTEEVDKGYIDEPYYMTPLALEKISNDELIKIVKKDGSILKKLPKLRVNHLPLKAKERLNILNEVSGNKEFDMGLLEELSDSEYRVLEEKVRFNFSTLEEESEVISLPDISLENMRQFPSLAWLNKISKESASDILNSYTARQLASVWIAPEEVLSELGELIPQKKRDLMASYQQTLEHDRESLIYEEIVELALEAYEKEIDNVVSLESKDEAA